MNRILSLLLGIFNSQVCTLLAHFKAITSNSCIKEFGECQGVITNYRNTQTSSGFDCRFCRTSRIGCNNCIKSLFCSQVYQLANFYNVGSCVPNCQVNTEFICCFFCTCCDIDKEVHIHLAHDHSNLFGSIGRTSIVSWSIGRRGVRICLVGYICIGGTSGEGENKCEGQGE